MTESEAITIKTMSYSELVITLQFQLVSQKGLKIIRSKMPFITRSVNKYKSEV